MSDSDWQDRAECRRTGVDLDWFFPQDGERSNPDGELEQVYGDDSIRARLICQGCPVKQQCWTENREAEVGIFAGTTERDRVALTKTVQRKTRGRLGLSVRDVPHPGRYIDWSRGRHRWLVAPYVLWPKHGPPVLSTGMQVALYAFVRRGDTLEAAAEAGGVDPKAFRRCLTPNERLAA